MAKRAGDRDVFHLFGSTGTWATFRGDEAGTYRFGSNSGTSSEFEDVNGSTGNDVMDTSAITSGIILTGGAGGDTAQVNYPRGSSMTMQGTTAAEMDEGGGYYATRIPCITAGKPIRTPGGDVPMARLRPGHMITTRDNGPQPVLWVAASRLDARALAANPRVKPMLIRPGAFGQHQALIGSPQHGLMLEPKGEERLFRATHPAQMEGGKVQVVAGYRPVTYLHRLFERHEVLFSNGPASKSF